MSPHSASPAISEIVSVAWESMFFRYSMCTGDTLRSVARPRSASTADSERANSGTGS